MYDALLSLQLSSSQPYYYIVCDGHLNACFFIRNILEASSSNLKISTVEEDEPSLTLDSVCDKRPREESEESQRSSKRSRLYTDEVHDDDIDCLALLPMTGMESGLICYQCVGTHPGCGLYDFDWRWYVSNYHNPKSQTIWSPLWLPLGCTLF